MEYTEMIDKVKALAVQNRAAQTEEEKDEVRRQMNILKSIDPKAFAVLLDIWPSILSRRSRN